jgi:hypothetical protein
MKAVAKRFQRTRGGFGEPYFSQQCLGLGGKYAAAATLCNQEGVCGICKMPVQASMYGASNCAVVPYEGASFFVCRYGAEKGRGHLWGYETC